MNHKLLVMRWVSAAAIVGSSVLLSGCFGGNDDDETPPAATSEVPGAASQSVGSFIAYLQALVASDADQLEPVDTGAVTPPTDDGAEPVAI